MNKLIAQLNSIVALHAPIRVNGKVASDRSVMAAGESLRASFNRIYDLGYKLEKPENISEKHIAALCKDWVANKRAPKTIQTNLSHLRIFCRWIGKGNMVKNIRYYVPDAPVEAIRVKTVADKSKSWSENGIDVIKVIREADAIDWRFGLMLRMQLSFGLRRMEVVQAIPWKNDMGDWFAAYATKGGRPRNIFIDTPEQRMVLDLVKSRLKKSETLGWTETQSGQRASLAYSIGRYSRLLPQIGISRESANVTGHGLRAQYAENAALIASLIPVTLGGTGGQMPKEDLDLHRLQISESLGHSRVSVTGAYYGSFGRNNNADSPDRTKAAIEAAVIPADHLRDIVPDRLSDCLQLTIELAAKGAYVEPRVAQVLWEHHSSRHAADWLIPGKDNVAALEAAANHFGKAV